MIRVQSSIARTTAIFFAASALFAATARAQGPAPTQAPAQSASAILQPALSTVHLTLQALRIDRWKKGSVRDEAGTNIDSIQNDLHNNLPPLLASADAAPAAVSKLLPLSRHVDALYDVLLRVTEASRVAGPDDQAAQLQQALTGLSTARLALDDRMQSSAGALEKQVVDLRTTMQQQAAKIAATPAPAALPCVPPPPAKKSPAKRKPAATPTAPAPAKPAQPATH